jgi:alkylation response protein AidB-like acyl-CoA dehydrogenase
VGGVGADFLSYLVALVSLGTAPIFHWATEAQKERYLPKLCASRKLWDFGHTDPEAGSDADTGPVGRGRSWQSTDPSASSPSSAPRSAPA